MTKHTLKILQCEHDKIFKVCLATKILKLSPSNPDPGLKEKVNFNFYFQTFVVPQKGFMKVVRTFIEPFEVPQRSVKKKIKLSFILVCF